MMLTACWRMTNWNRRTNPQTKQTHLRRCRKSLLLIEKPVKSTAERILSLKICTYCIIGILRRLCRSRSQRLWFHFPLRLVEVRLSKEARLCPPDTGVLYQDHPDF
jgi:hypothetical protein